jgi:tRNA(Ile)-lysidine synthase
VNGKIIRPLLAFTKAELIKICQTAAINTVHDPSNLDTDFDRVRMRNWLSATPNPMDAPSAARSASALDDADQALTWMTVRLIPERLTLHSNSATLDASGLPREIQRRLLLRALNHLEPNAVHRGSAIEDGLNRLSAGQTITLANTLCQGGITWHFTPAPPRNSAKMRRD